VDWGTISSLATAFGTLVLAVATFASIRSANRAARTADRALSFNIRPPSFAPLETFRPQTRDLYIAPGDAGFWQGAIRDRADAMYAPMAAAITAQQSFLIEVQYCNAEGGQRTISRFLFFPIGETEKGWLCSVGRHFSLDHDLPR
jgi:hypothetical protein